jgi:predicted RNase H-like HicB family nuclease
MGSIALDTFVIVFVSYAMNFRIELDREEDGRWIAEVLDIPGVLVYGKSREEAMLKAQSLALRVLAERIDLGEVSSMPLIISFLAA